MINNEAEVATVPKKPEPPDEPRVLGLSYHPNGGLWPMQPTPEPDILTAEQVATLLQMNETHIYKLAKDGKIPSFKIGGQRRFSRKALEAWIQAGGTE